MQLYTWGSASHAGLGYIVSHSVKTVETPRRVPGHSFSTVVAGSTFTAALNKEGKLVKWGHQFGCLSPVVAGITEFEKIASASDTGQCLMVEKLTGIVHKDEKPIIYEGKLLYAKDIALVAQDHFLIIERGTGKLIEQIPAGTRPWLSRTDIKALAPCRAVYASNRYAAVVHEESGEVWIFGPGIEKPRKIIASQNFETETWKLSSSEFVVKSPISMSLPSLADPSVGYVLVNGGETAVRFHIGSTGSVISGTVIFPSDSKYVSVAQNRDNVYLVSISGDLFEVPHESTLVAGTVRLSQVVSVSCSPNHTAALVNTLNPPLAIFPNEFPRLQLLCTQALMKSVTPENVVLVLTELLERAIVDVPDLLNACWAYFRLNSALIRCITPEVRMLEFESRSDISVIMSEDENDVSFSEKIIKIRRELQPIIEAIPHDIHKAKPRRKKTNVSYQKLPSTSSSTVSTAVPSRAPSPAMTPVIAVSVIEGGEDLFELEDFVPLSGDCGAAKHTTPLKKVSKWKRQSITSPPVAPWLSPPLAGMEPQSPPLASVLAEELASVQRQTQVIGRRVTKLDSRWFVERDLEESVADIMRREQEERETQEAIRLVEEYERAVAAHNRSRSKLGKSHR